MIKLDHLTVAIPNHQVAMTEATRMLELLGLREVPPDTQYAARNTAWTYKHFEDDNGFKVHVVQEGEGDEHAGPPGLTHFRAVVTQDTFRALKECNFLERDAGSGRIWLAGPGTLRAEVITTEGLLPEKRPEFGVEGPWQNTPEEVEDGEPVWGTVFTPEMVENITHVPKHLAEHQNILEHALSIMSTRDPQYGDSWKNYGWRGAIFNMRRKAERVWHVLFNQPDDHHLPGDEDDLLDIINYCAMAIACMRECNRDGRNGWWRTD
jgi:hypothetical protein